jgi:hypothetical protein
MIMRSTWFTRVGGSALLLALLTATFEVPGAAAGPIPSQPRRPRASSLFAAAGLLLDVNRQLCGLANTGQVCVAFAGSPVGGGGFWPKGTPDQYIFQSGIQLAGIIPSGITGFTWSGDTVGAYFVNTSGGGEHGDGLTLIYNSLNAQDNAQWPNGAFIRDTALFDQVLIGRKSASQGDSWVREWEGDPALTSGRTHPMGIAIDQRSLAWNYPTGNEDILYFIFTFYNITARSSSGKYNNPTIDPALQTEIGAIGDKFQDLNEQKYAGLQIPDTGYTISSLYSAFTMDADVAVFSTNYGTAVLPFNMGIIYAGDFLPEVGWQFPPDIFGAPFFAAPGFVGVKYLRSPESSPGVQVGLTMFSTFSNPSSGTGFPDPAGVRQLYRYLSGFLGPTDFPCNSNTDPAIARALRLCFLAQFQADARFFQSSGPFSLPPGEARTIVVAYVQAAALAAPLLALPGGGPGGDNPPGVPATGDSIAVDPVRLVRPIEKVMGWESQSDTSGICAVPLVKNKCPAGQNRPNNRIDQTEVGTAPRSLLNKALVAQAVFDNKFLLPFAPEAPQFFLVPGDNQVTVVWQKSVSETTGDPYFAVASNSGSPLYDPNFRQFDVEGYRVYRGRTAGQLELIVQFDYDGTQLVDFTGGFDYPDGDGDGLLECAPELGLQDDCPVTFSTAPPYIESVPHPLTGNVVQIPPGQRVELASGSVLNLKADTAVTGGPPACAGERCPELKSPGVPFAFVDTDVRNSFTYFYSVTAFDVNSVASGPSSLESPRIAKSIVPRVASGQEAGASVTAPIVLDRAGNTLNTSASLPAITGATAIFAGPMPPTNGFSSGLPAFTPAMVTGGTVTITIDSLIPGHANTGTGLGTFRPTIYYVSVAGPTGTTQVTLPLTVDAFSGVSSILTYAPAAALDAAKSEPFGGDPNFAMTASVTIQAAGTYRLASWGRGAINSDPTRSAENGPRWWAGTPNETTVRPNRAVCNPVAGGCARQDTVANFYTNNAGSIAGYQVFHPQSYSTVNSAPMREVEAIGSGAARAADFKLYWGAAGVVDSVIDVTHNMVVPFKASMRASWGILDTSSFTGVTAANTRDGNNLLLTWWDVTCADPVPTLVGPGLTIARAGGGTRVLPICGATPAAALKNRARLSPIDMRAWSFVDTTATPGTQGDGFIIYLNGHFTLFLGALPATGTVWNARFYSGRVRGVAPTTDPDTAKPPFSFAGSTRPPAVPGLRAQFQFTGSQFSANVTNDSVFAKIHTVPDPYYVTNALEFTQNTKVLKFVNIPMRAIVRIYSVSGVLVRVLTHDDPTGGSEVTWNLRNRNNQFVASGVYFYHVETPDGKKKIGRFTVVNFAP